MKKLISSFLLLCAVAQTQQITPNNVQPQAKQGNSMKFQLAGMNSGISGALLCNDSHGNSTTTSCSAGSVPTGVSLTVPSWLTVTGNNTFSLTVTPTTGQTSHKVIGTCGAGTTFAPCIPTLSDVASWLSSPSLVAGANIAVTGTWPNQTIAATGLAAGFSIPSAYTWAGAGWSTNGHTDALNLNINNYPTDAFFFANLAPIVSGISVSLKIPSTASASNQTAGVAGYVTNDGAAGATGIGGLFMANQNNAGIGSALFGINAIAQNCWGGVGGNCANGAGIPALNIYSGEFDINAYTESGGILTSNFIGIQIAGDVRGQNTPGKTMTALNIVPAGVHQSPVIRWKNAIDVGNGSADTAINIGWQTTGPFSTFPAGGSGSMPIYWQSIDVGNITRNWLMNTDLNGNMFYQPTAGFFHDYSQFWSVNDADGTRRLTVSHGALSTSAGEVFMPNNTIWGSAAFTFYNLPTPSTSQPFYTWCSDCVAQTGVQTFSRACASGGGGTFAVYRPSLGWYCL